MGVTFSNVFTEHVAVAHSSAAFPQQQSQIIAKKVKRANWKHFTFKTKKEKKYSVS